MYCVVRITPDTRKRLSLAAFSLCLRHNELLSKPALRSGHPVFRGDGFSGSIEASVAMHGVFLYAVFFNGFLAGPEEGSFTPSLSFSPLPFAISLYLLPRPLLANLRAFFPSSRESSPFLRASTSIALALLAVSSSVCLLPRHRYPLFSFSPR